MVSNEHEADGLDHYVIDNIVAEYQLIINDKRQLQTLYMPYINKGGIFINTTKDYQLDDEVTLSLTLFEDPTPYIIIGKVVWINPKFTQGGHSQGIGIQFINKEARVVRDKIENALAGFIGETDSMTM
jgi:type IV pilus assembly protein PilZ